MPEVKGRRVDLYLSQHFPFLSRAGWQARLEDGEVLVNTSAVRSSYKLKIGDLLTMYHPHVDEPEVDGGIRVLYEEAGVMVVFKPGNLPMHENGPYRKNTLANILAQKVGKEWAAVHRLDRETSGVVLCGATAELRGELAEDLAKRRVLKEYLAIAKGSAKERSWIVDADLGDLKDSAIRIKKWVVPHGLSERTDFQVLESTDSHKLLRALPKTGRTNQIRIHAAYSGLPIVGDKLYHSDEQVFLDYFEHGNCASVQERVGFHRLCLHATSLTFRHPKLNAERYVESPLPQDLSDLWSRLVGLGRDRLTTGKSAVP